MWLFEVVGLVGGAPDHQKRHHFNMQFVDV